MKAEGIDVDGDYPTESVTFIAAAPPGGGWHQTCEATVRILNQEGFLSVEARMVETPGGLKVLEKIVTHHRGDVHTLVAFSPGLTLQILMKGSQYTYADITPIASLSTDYGVLVVPTASPIHDLPDLIARLKRDPAAITVTGGSGPGAMHHGMIALVASSAHLGQESVRYVGAESVAAGIKAVREGQAPLGAFGAADVAVDVEGGILRPIAALAEARLSVPFADVPTAVEQGVNVVFPMWRGFYAPPEISDEVVAFWGHVFTRLNRTAAWTQLLEERRWLPFLLSGEQFRSFLAQDTARYATALGLMSRGTQ